VVDPAYNVEDLDVQPIRSPSAMNAAYQEVMLWNGQFGASGPNDGTESQWTDDMLVNHLGYQGIESQAIAALLVHRMASARFASLETSILATDSTYQALWRAAFGSAPVSREFAGLAIAAYERTLLATEAPFQRWLRGNRNALTDQEKQGALIFFGKGECYACHTGPALNSMSFHALGMADLNGPDVRIPLANPIKPLGRGAFSGLGEDAYAFKTPQLYNLVDSPFLGHGSSFRGVRAVIDYKNRALQEAAIPDPALSPLFRPLGLTEAEVTALTAFIETGLRDPDLDRFVPETLPSGNCFPVNDQAARVDLGC
jgi:cytochrome c peroxidase